MDIQKFAIYLLPLLAMALGACSEADAPTSDGWPDDLYISVDMVEAESRLTYHVEPNFFDNGNLAARWEIGDIIKVYETTEVDGSLTQCYSSYADYESKWEYPAAPTYDKYYRFECVGGEGTAHGIFKYIGLATANVFGGTDGTYNVGLDITYYQKINNWRNFDGVVIYGNPLRNYMMRHQEQNDDMKHLKYGQRMRGHLCNYNFANWSSNSDGKTGNISGFVLYNTASCIYKIVMDGFEDDIYGGATLSLSMPGVTSGHVHSSSLSPCYRNSPMSLTLGNVFDHQELREPWCYGNSTTTLPVGGTRTITAYVVGWPGTVKSKDTITVRLEDHFYGKSYTWTMYKNEDIVFEEDHYYTFVLTGANNRKPVVASDVSQTTP